VATAETHIGSQFAYFGFTGATGGLSEQQQVQVVGLHATTETGTLLTVGEQAPTFTVNGNAVSDAAPLGGASNATPFEYTVTPDALYQHGSVMSDLRVDVTKAFEITFAIDVGNKANGADGMGFVLHNDPLGHFALGDMGGGMGMMGIKNGLGIEFDTYQNANDLSDIATDHTNFVNTGTGGNNPAVGPVTSLGNIKDGYWHQVDVMSDGQTISYEIDGVKMSSMSLATAETYLGGSHFAYFGFTGATGGLSEQEQVRLMLLQATAENGEHLRIGSGGTGINDIFGTTGNDVLYGVGASAVLSGQGGNDRLIGGPGNDTFVFAPGYGTDTITNFTRAVGNRDLIDLSAFHFASGADALSHAVANGADTVFNFGNGDTLTVQHTAAGNVTNLLVDDLKV
jgi:Ca2+-binding RTX toxin-like protein